MKWYEVLIFFLVAVLLILLCCDADASEGRKHDKHLITLATMAFIDYQQSTKMFYERTGCIELNPILGDSPERGDLLLFGSAALALAYGVNKLMPEGGFKDFFGTQSSLQRNSILKKIKEPWQPAIVDSSVSCWFSGGTFEVSEL